MVGRRFSRERHLPLVKALPNFAESLQVLAGEIRRREATLGQRKDPLGYRSFRINNLWLGGRDSNPDKQSQSLLSYRWTTSQHGRWRHGRT